MIGIHYIKHLNDKSYVVKSEVLIDKFIVKGTNNLNMDLAQAYRDWMGCDHVLLYYFLYLL